MNQRHCPITGHEIGPDRHASPAAAGQLRATLAHLPDLMQELETTITRQVRMAESPTRNRDDRLPFNIEASERAWTLRQTLLIWADHLAHTRNEPIPDTWPNIRDTYTTWSDWMTTTEAGVQAIDEILDAHHHALRAIDRPPDRTYSGPCPTCSGDVYGQPGTTLVRCTTCATEFDHDEARTAMLDKLAVMHLPATDAARAIHALTGDKITPAKIRGWKRHEKIHPTGVNTAGQPLYDLTQIIELLNKRNERIRA